MKNRTYKQLNIKRLGVAKMLCVTNVVNKHTNANEIFLQRRFTFDEMM